MSGSCCGAASSVVPTVTAVSADLTLHDRLGALRMRLNVGRADYRVTPGLYRVGSPSPDSPVLVTANYKLSFDHVRSAIAGLDAWLLAIDTHGINVWCAAGKGTLGTMNVSRAIVESGLADVVSHRTVIVPQLGATGVAAHDVRAFTGFRVVFGPVRAEDLPRFLANGMQATPAMRTVTFGLRDRLVLTGVELSTGWKPATLTVLALLVALSGLGVWGFSRDAVLARGAALLAAGYAGLLAGALAMPALLPWLPFRAFSAKGALLGAVPAVVLAVHFAPSIGWLAAAGAACATVAIASYVAMNFTGASAITSLSGVQAEMRRALPWQVASGAVAVVAWVASAFLGRGW